MQNQQSSDYVQPWYPLFLDLADRPALIVGGGEVAARKMQGLLEAGARITVIAPRAAEEIERLAGEERIRLRRREWQTGDCRGFTLVYAATDTPAINTQVCTEAAEWGQLYGSTDGPPAGGFAAPATVRRGPLTLAVSTTGRIPALTAALRHYFERKLYPGIGEEIEAAAAERERLLAERPHQPHQQQQRQQRKNTAGEELKDLRSQLRPMIDAIIGKIEKR